MSISSKLKQLVSSDNLGRRMASGIVWSFTGTFLAKFIVLVSGIVCARLMGKGEYGEFGMIRSTINMFVVVGTAGIGLTAAKYISEFRRYDAERIPSIYILSNLVALVAGAAISLLIWFLAPLLADNLGYPSLLSGIRIGTLLLFITILNTSQNGCLQGFECFKAISINTFLGSLAESVLMLVGAYFWGVQGAILGFGMGFVVLYIANYISTRCVLHREGIPVSLRLLNKKDFRILYQFSMPAILTSLSYAGVFWFVKTMLVHHDSFEELAVFEAADQWKIIILFIPTAIGQVVLPILSGLLHDNRRFWQVLYLNMAINGGIALLLSLGVFLFGDFIMALYGKSYTGNTLPLVFLCLTTVFMAMSNVVGLSITSKAKMWTGLSFNIIWATVLLTATHILLEKGLGATGLALAFLVSYILHTAIQLTYLKLSIKRQKTEQ